MACEGTTTGQCLVDEIPVCCPPIFQGPGAPSDTFGRNPECWVSLPGSTSSGLGILREILGCGSGCMPCKDDPGSLFQMTDQVEGDRWLAPDLDAPAHLDAFGLRHDLRSNEGRLVPRVVQYRRGACWENDGQECFGANVCSCFGENHAQFTANKEGRCGGGVTAGHPVIGRLTDNFFMVGHRWPYRAAGPDRILDGEIHCRKFTDSLDPDPPDHHVVLAPRSLFGVLDPIFSRTGGPGGTSGRFPDCSANWLVNCTGRISGAVCPGAFQFVESDRVYFNEDESRIRFEEMLILTNTARLRTDSPLMPEADQRTIAVKNRILEFSRTHQFELNGGTLRFDRVDHQIVAFQSNSFIGYYWRIWSGLHLPEEQRPRIPGVLGNCTLRHAGCTVPCELIVDIVRYQVTFVPRAINLGTPNNPNPHVEPHARVRIQVVCSVKADLPDGCVLHQPWKPEGDPDRETTIRIVNDPSVGSLPDVTPEGLDELILRDTEGRTVRPPLLTEWYGYLGYHGQEPTSRQQRFPLIGQLGPTPCDAVANGLQGTRIPGWPYIIEGGDDRRDHVYDGELVIGFRP